MEHQLSNVKVSQTVYDQLLWLTRCEDACWELLGYLEDTLTPDDSPSFSVIRSLHESISMRLASLVDHSKYEKLPF